jgi:hypothetical protein
MSGAEQRGLPYLFKLRLTANVKKLIKKTFSKSGWTDAGQGWQGRHETLRLSGVRKSGLPGFAKKHRANVYRERQALSLRKQKNLSRHSLDNQQKSP